MKSGYLYERKCYVSLVSVVTVELGVVGFCLQLRGGSVSWEVAEA